MTRNRLDGETSPYLRQHKDNPVHWQPWDAAALALARAENKPILLSVGYSTCHWCHVMARESFENPEIAALMNELFVNIKVDREERPDLDAIYQTALALLGQPGGWPLTMFLTPEGEPFWGGTYFPPTARYGRPGFPEVLRAVHKAYRTAPEKVALNRTAILGALDEIAARPAGEPVSLENLDTAARTLLAEIDPINGGIGTAPKFPQPLALELLWRAYCRTGQAAFRDAAVSSLRHICNGGIYDHLGGGFARYAVDGRWLVPHFEKMLYDNALLVGLLSQIWLATGDDLFKKRTVDTVAWLLREMSVSGGGFASAFDADSEGEEGRFYTWEAAEIDRLLGPGDAARFRAAYDVRDDGNWEGRTILHRNHPGAAQVPEDDDLAAMRATLFAARAKRVPPARDDKVLADWNGLAIAALAFAGEAFDRADWVAAAARAFAFVRAKLGAEENRLHHSYCDGKVRGHAILDDYANMARAALALYEATAETAYLSQAAAWVETVETFFRDQTLGGYYLTPSDGERLIVRTRSAADSATPAGNATLLDVLARLHALTAEAVYRDRAEALMAAFGAEARRNPFAHCAFLNAVEIWRSPIQVVIVGEDGSDDTRALARAALETPNPNRVLSRIAPGTALPAGHPASGRAMIDGRATAYVCAGQTCSLPITDPPALRSALAPRAAPS